MSHAQIGKVTFKRGGATLRVLHTVKSDDNGTENWRGEVLKSARAVAEFSEPGSELCGWLVIGLYTDGAHSFGYRLDESRSRVPRLLLPAYVAELVRRDIVTKKKFDAMSEPT